MGLLDDLKHKAEKKKAGEQAEKEKWQRLERHYQDEIHPRMVALYNYLNQMVQHINYLESDIIANFPLGVASAPQPLRQRDYKLNVDSANKTRNITLLFRCHLDEKLKIEIDGKEKVLAYTELLDSYNIKYHRRDNKGEDYEIIASRFVVEGPINISVSFIGDVEQSAVNLLIKNFEKPGISKQLLRAPQLDEAFMDRLGKYLLRESDDYLSLSISEGIREELRERVSRENAAREEELREMEAQAEREKFEARPGLKSLFSRKKKDPDTSD